MRVAIVGSGGVGGYFGAKLALAGNKVVFLARNEHRKAMQEKGLSVKSVGGDFHIEQVNVVSSISEMGLSDLIIVAVKAWQVKELADQLNTICHENTIVLPLQNGVLAHNELSLAIKQGKVLAGLCRILSKIESPGVINHFGIDPTIIFGDLSGKYADSCAILHTLLTDAEINTVNSPDIQTDLWKKFIAICVSGLLAVTNTTYGEILSIPETRQMTIALLKEIFLLSKKVGAKVNADFVAKTMAFYKTFPYNSNSSLTRDVLAGKPSEIEYQNGTVVKLADKFGVEVPVNRFVYYSILPREKKARS